MAENSSFDYIICGGGMAGLSLVWHLNQRTELKNKSILILEQEEKNLNDRTWAFWEKESGPFEDLVFRTWHQFKFVTSSGKERIFPFKPYAYKVIRGIDFYKKIDTLIANSPQITRLRERVKVMEDTPLGVIVSTESGKTFRAELAFDSISRPSLDNPRYNNLLQHFKGYVLETKVPVFDIETPDIMNFSVPQVNDECRFIYVLPFERNKALVEYTLFSDNLIPPEAYEKPLKEYIEEKLQLKDYTIIETEFGIIPMSDAPFEQHPGRNILRIGTAGGYTHAATGFTFKATQTRLALLADLLSKGKSLSDFIAVSAPSIRHKFYPSVLLGVLRKKMHPAADVFRRFYGEKEVEDTFRFLDMQTNLWQEIKIFIRMPIWPFLKSALQEMVKRV